MNERNIELAIEAGFNGRREWPLVYEKFADILRADEREACAKIVEESSLPDAYSEPCLLVIAEEIRARGQA